MHINKYLANKKESNISLARWLSKHREQKRKSNDKQKRIQQCVIMIVGKKSMKCSLIYIETRALIR